MSTSALVGFTSLFFLKYTRLLVAVIANIAYRPYTVAQEPKFNPSDATVIVPTTYRKPKYLALCLHSILASEPAAIVLVTAKTSVQDAEALCRLLAPPGTIQVIGVEKLNKRGQVVHGLQFVKTKMTILADDNVIWPDWCYLQELLAVFEDPAIGAGGTRQRVHRDTGPGVFDFLAISYLERRVFNNIATQAIDGSISTLSGRTIACRTCIIKNERFADYFQNTTWQGMRLRSDDDKCLTRFIYSNGWKIAIQTSVCIETRMEPGYCYMVQCLRWARSHWRGNMLTMANESYWYRRHPWGLYYIYIGQLQTPAVFWDGLLLYLLNKSLRDSAHRTHALIILAIWIVLTKLVKLVPHFVRHPEDLLFVPVSILFSYFHGFLNIYALCTLHELNWATQALHDLELPITKRMSAVPSIEELLAELSDTDQLREQQDKDMRE